MNRLKQVTHKVATIMLFSVVVAILMAGAIKAGLFLNSIIVHDDTPIDNYIASLI